MMMEKEEFSYTAPAIQVIAVSWNTLVCASGENDGLYDGEEIERP